MKNTITISPTTRVEIVLATVRVSLHSATIEAFAGLGTARRAEWDSRLVSALGTLGDDLAGLLAQLDALIEQEKRGRRERL